MPLLKYIQRMQRIDALIRRKATGNADELAKKLNLSRSAIMEYIHDLRELGFPIGYNKRRHSFYYEHEGKMVDNLFKDETMSEDEQNKTKGGSAFIKLF